MILYTARTWSLDVILLLFQNIFRKLWTVALSQPENNFRKYTLKVENFMGTKFRGSKKPRNFCVSRVLNFAVAPSK